MNYSVGLQNVGSYQVSGQPWLKTMTVAEGIQEIIHLPNVSKRIRIKKQSNLGELKMAFGNLEGDGVQTRCIDFSNNLDTLRVQGITGISQFSVSFWVNFSELTTNQIRIVEIINSGGNHSVVAFEDNTSPLDVIFRFVVGGNQLSIPFQHVVSLSSLDSWHNIVITSNATSNILYLDGNQIQTNINTASPLTGVEIGGTLSGYDGRYDEMTLWDKVLTPSEVLELYNSGNYLDPSLHSANTNLVSWWAFEDNGNGNVFEIPDENNTIFDRIGSNNLLLNEQGGTPNPDISFVDAQTGWISGGQSNVVSGRHYLTLVEKSEIEISCKCKALYLLAEGSDVQIDILASLTSIPADKMYELTGPGIDE